LRWAALPLPSIRNPLKALVSGTIASTVMIVLDRCELFWLVNLVVGGVVYLVCLALTRAIPRDLVLSVLRRRRVAYQGSA
jgi:hypothetical protein